MSFPIRKIGMLEMPKIAMLSTNCNAVYNQALEAPISDSCGICGRFNWYRWLTGTDGC